MNEKVYSDATIEGDALFDSNLPTTSAENTRFILILKPRFRQA